ncbi:MAG TPA: DUF4012 domain-containing protein, partial [Patescibacteria group bacterium]|nr:DUF4012 domain-containing protein [Patescibacteria group bacterium]
MKKKVKLYLHHSHYEPVTYNKRTGLFAIVARFFELIANAVMTFFYGIGLLLITLIKLPVTIYKLIIKLPQTIHSIVKQLHIARFRKTMAVFALCVIVLASGIHGLSLIAAGLDVKGRVLGESDTGFGYLQEAKTSLQAQNTEAAQANFNRALEQFKNSQATLNSTSADLQGILAVVPQKHDADKLLEAAQKITEAAIKGTELLNLTNNMKLSAVGLSAGTKNREMLLKAQGLLNDSVQLADESASLINEVSISSIPQQYQATFLSAKDTATFFQANVASVKEVCSLIFDILLGQKNTLIVFQNNNELRASGGFMGTVGNAKLNDGSLTSLDIRSVYDWDGQLKQKVLPPQPMYVVNNQWFMRDSNWFGSFPDSAERIGAFFEKEGGETPDLVIAMTPDVILAMLDKTGPINLPQHGITLTKDNFIEEVQRETSVDYDKQLNQPKQFLADFFPLLMEKLGSDQGGIISFLEVFQQSLYKKEIVMYSRNSDLENKINSFNWGGQLRSTDRDYLSIVNSNLGGTKTDRSLERSAELRTTINKDGTVTNNLQYTVKNPLPNSPGLSNKTFIRFYVPEGSKLNSGSGFNQDIQLPVISNDGYTIDDKVQEWQKGVQQDTASGTYYGNEAGKTWFGNWLIVDGGQTKTVTLNYTL